MKNFGLILFTILGVCLIVVTPTCKVADCKTCSDNTVFTCSACLDVKGFLVGSAFLSGAD